MKQDSKLQIAQKYAMALYENAEEKKSVAKIQGDIDKIFDILSKDQNFITSLSNPLWKKETKKEALKQIGQKVSLSPDIMRFLDLIVDNNRIRELGLVLREFKRIYFKKHEIKEVEVQSVKELTSSQEKKLVSNLEKMLSSKVIVHYKINPEILGGLIVRCGSNMIDDSIKGKLNKIESLMKEGL